MSKSRGFDATNRPGNIDPGSFDSADMTFMNAAVDEAWRQLLVDGSPLTSSENEVATRELLGKAIMKAASAGERDRHRLASQAVTAAKNPSGPVST